QFASYEYDDHGNLIGATDADGHTTRYAYDGAHRLVVLTYPNGLEFHFKYDRVGRCIETWGTYPGRKDPALATTLPDTLADERTPSKGIYHCKLDFVDEDYTEVIDSVRLRRFFAGPQGKIAQAVNARGGVTSRTFDELGNVTSQTDPTGGTWSYAYDYMGNVVRATSPEGHTVLFERDGAGQEIEIADAGGGISTIERDDQGEVIGITDPNGATLNLFRDDRALITRVIDQRDGEHRFEHDAHGNCVARVFPNGSRYEYQYDFWGRLVSQANPTGASQQYTCSPAGRLLSAMDPAGGLTRFDYDSMGNLVARTEPDGWFSRMEYGGLNWCYRQRFADGTERRVGHNREGWPLWMENERGERHTFVHEPDGLIASEVNFHGEQLRYGRDKLGRMVWFEDGSGRREFELDATGQLLAETSLDGGVRSLIYSQRGEVIAFRSDDNLVEWERDATGNVVRETFYVGGNTYTVESTRNRAGDRTALRTSLGHRLDIQRDENGRVKELWSGEARVLAIGRDSRGLPVRRELPQGGAIVDEYDAKQRLRRRQVVPPGAHAAVGEPEWVGRGAPGIADRLYDYTAGDELIKITASNGDDVAFEYDERRRLTAVSGERERERWSYDAAGNHHNADPMARPRTYGTGSQILRDGDTTFTYDDHGSLVEKRKAGPPELVTRYEWNDWELLAAVTLPDGRRIEFDYDQFARRLAKRVLRDGAVERHFHYVWDGLSLLHEVELEGADPRNVRTFLYEGDEHAVPLGHRDDDEWVYYVGDINNTPERIVDATAQVVGTLERTVWGRTTSTEDSTTSTPFRAPGQFEDGETGLFYNRYRYYDPDLGRFISSDPIGIDGNFNLYEYAVNPVGWSDPMGWKHSLRVDGPPAFHDRVQGRAGHTHASDRQHQYLSGRHGVDGNRCPPRIDNDTSCHTEQKFCDDLLRFAESGGDVRGERFRLTGNLPPCPTCHGAMLRTSQETGAEIDYSWEQPKGTINNIRYSGGSASPTQGAAARRLTRDYDHQEQSGWDRSASRRASGCNNWGYSSSQSAQDAYRREADRAARVGATDRQHDAPLID
ncbi:MAG: RHS repeat-associated core domain-containing protein, partial [Polyangiaceae bacterium]